MIQRPYYENMLRARLAEERHFIQVVLGPRQVGKTWAKLLLCNKC